MAMGFELPQQSQYPCLLHGIDREEKKIFHSIFEGTPFSSEFSYLRNKSLISTRNGWWILRDDECIFILNPRTMERFELPKLDRSYKRYWCVLSDSPKSIDCRFLLFGRASKNVLFCKIGDCSFAEQELAFSAASVAVVGGRIYAAAFQDCSTLVSFWFEGETLKTEDVIETDVVALYRQPQHSFVRYKTCLIESNDELLLLYKIYSPSTNYVPPYNLEVADFLIFKLGYSSFCWRELRAIGDHRVLFLQGEEGIACNVDGGGSKMIQGNCIYYVDSHSYHLHAFDLKDGGISEVTYTTPLPDANYEKHRFQWISLPLLEN